MITSPSNKRVAAAARLKKRAMREKDRRFLVEGVRTLSEAVAAKAPVHELFRSVEAGERVGPLIALAEGAGIPVHEVSQEVMSHLTSTVTPQGVVGVSGFIDVSMTALPAAPALVAVLVDVRDPGNVGTIVRSADAAGADAVVFSGHTVDVYNPKAVRASAGSLFHLPVVRGTDLGEAVASLRRRGLMVLAADGTADRSVYDLDLRSPSAILFGNEARGLGGEAVALADAAVRVPIHRAESLNLAAAATVILFEAARQRS